MRKTEISWKTPKNVPIFGNLWQPDGSAKGVIVLVHGIGEHIGRYEHVAKMFTDNNFAMIGVDLIGHGKSGGQRGHVDSYDDYCGVIDWMIKEGSRLNPGLPMILYGHSLGGNLVLYHSMKHSLEVAGVIATSPGLEVTRVPPLKLLIGKVMYSVWPSFSMTNSLDVTGLSTDQSVIDNYKADPLVHPYISARLGIDLLDSGQWIRENGTQVKFKLLLMHGEKDRLANVSGTRYFVKNTDGLVTYKEFAGGYHELHNGPEKDQVFSLFLSWIDKEILRNSESIPA